MEAEIQRVRAWLANVLPAQPQGHLLGPFLTHHIDDLLTDMGLPTRRTGNVVSEYLGPFGPARYRNIADQQRPLLKSAR
jgi:dimethylaniline monooxygenase (N-oxide forming)